MADVKILIYFLFFPVRPAYSLNVIPDLNHNSGNEPQFYMTSRLPALLVNGCVLWEDLLLSVLLWLCIKGHFPVKKDPSTA